MDARPLALATGASTGIGYELAKLCVQNGFDAIIAADEPEIWAAAKRLCVEWLEEQASGDYRQHNARRNPDGKPSKDGCAKHCTKLTTGIKGADH